MAEVMHALPEPSLEDRPYWEGLRRHELLIQKCNSCGALQHPARPMCAQCHSTSMDWMKASGRGSVYSYTIHYDSNHPAWKDKVPFNVVIVELEEDVRVISNLVDIANEDICVGLPVEVVYDDVTPDVTLPRFRLATA